jgi:chromosomal replication initiation ATPase DnaA
MKGFPHGSGMDALVAISLHNKQKKRKSLSGIFYDVCYALGQEVEKVRAGSTKELSLCKKIFCYVARKKTRRHLVHIATEMGVADHTTVRHHVLRVKGFLKVKDPGFMEAWDKYLDNSRLFTRKDFK